MSQSLNKAIVSEIEFQALFSNQRVKRINEIYVNAYNNDPTMQRLAMKWQWSHIDRAAEALRISRMVAVYWEKKGNFTNLSKITLSMKQNIDSGNFTEINNSMKQNISSANFSEIYNSMEESQ